MPLPVIEVPLMVLAGAVPASSVATVRMIEPDDPALAAAVAAQDRGFGGTGEGLADRPVSCASGWLPA